MLIQYMKPPATKQGLWFGRARDVKAPHSFFPDAEIIVKQDKMRITILSLYFPLRKK